MFYNSPSYLGGEVGSNEKLAIKYHLDKAKNSSYTQLGGKSFMEAQNKYYGGGKIYQNRYLIGPTDDKDAYYTISWLAAIAARGVDESERQPLIEYSEDYLSKGDWTTPINVFTDNRKSILLTGLNDISSLIGNTNSTDTYSVAIGTELAKDSSLAWNDREKGTLDYLYDQAIATAEQGARLAQLAAETIEAGAAATKAVADAASDYSENKDEIKDKIQKIKKITAYVGLFGTLAYVFYRIQRVRK